MYEDNGRFITPSYSHAIVRLPRPHLENASQVWTPLYEIYKNRIESAQCNFISFAFEGLPWSDS